MVNPGEPITVKLYGNRRLYQPGAARSVALSQLLARKRDGIVVILRDATTGADITDQILFPHRLSPRRTEH
jgi:polyhydroxyalkanoate synthesis regulator protein